jgi:uncharacterized protein with FMN-binding domain
MNSTKIIVIQLKELLYTVVFAVLGLILIGALIFMLLPNKKDKTTQVQYQPGIYSSSFMLKEQPVNLEVTVNENEITSVRLMDMTSELELMYPLVQPTIATLERQIVKHQRLDITLASDSPATSQVLLQAVENALSKAKVPQKQVIPQEKVIPPGESIEKKEDAVKPETTSQTDPFKKDTEVQEQKVPTSDE